MSENISEERFAKETLERYSGSEIGLYQSSIILTNFPQYVEYFAETRNVKVHEGSMFKVAHCPKEEVSILDFKIGSPAAALVIDLCSFLQPKAAVLLGMCAGLRRRYQVGDYLVPVASIRDEGTSNFYFPPEVPALANFLMQKAVTHVLDKQGTPYHIGITYTSNTRFWEFNEPFVNKLKATKAQGYEMECATLFTASYKRKFTLGALLLISDLPLNQNGVKTKESSAQVFDQHMSDHVENGVKILEQARKWQGLNIKGSYHRNLGID